MTIKTSDEVIERAAQKLADCMDYPWKHITNKGRESMRKHARSIVEEALAAQRERACEWQRADDSDNFIYHAACGFSQYFNCGTPEDNDVIFCACCGGKVVELIRESGE